MASVGAVALMAGLVLIGLVIGDGLSRPGNAAHTSSSSSHLANSTIPISQQIGTLERQLYAAQPTARAGIIQQLMKIANSHPGTKSVSNPVLAILIRFAVIRSGQARKQGQPPLDLYAALHAIGGADGNAFNSTPDMVKDLSGANLSSLNLAGLQYNYGVFTDADLRGVNLSGAGLDTADLAGADLANADLTDAQLQHADLRNANLAGANFSGANLGGTLLSCAELSHAQHVPSGAAAHCSH